MINAWTLKHMKDNEIIFINHGVISNHSDKYIITSGVHDIAQNAREGAMLVKFYRENCIVQRKGDTYIVNDYTTLNTLEQVYKYTTDRSFILIY